LAAAAANNVTTIREQSVTFSENVKIGPYKSSKEPLWFAGIGKPAKIKTPSATVLDKVLAIADVKKICRLGCFST